MTETLPTTNLFESVMEPFENVLTKFDEKCDNISAEPIIEAKYTKVVLSVDRKRSQPYVELANKNDIGVQRRLSMDNRCTGCCHQDTSQQSVDKQRKQSIRSNFQFNI